MLRRPIFRITSTILSKNGYATATPAPPPVSSAANELKFTLASASKAYYTNHVVKQVDVPTLAGIVGVLSSHVPIIASLKPGLLQVYGESGDVTKLFVSSGSMSMNNDGSLQVLAEEIALLSDIDQAVAQDIMSENQKKTEGSEVEKAEAGIRAEVSEALIKALSGAQ